MNELETARAIAAGDLPSPQPCGGAQLWALRITGTGIAERAQIREYTFRDPATFLSAEMQRRCLGLPIVVGHPASGLLDGAEHAARNVGSVVHTYVADAALWCIGRIYDDAVNAALGAGALSTSPSVIARAAASLPLGDGGALVIEGVPDHIDHLALVKAGVWDRGNIEARGVRADAQGIVNMDPEKEKPAEGGDGAAADSATEALKKILAAVVDLGGRLDAVTTRLDTACSRLDAMDNGDGARDGAMQQGAAELAADGAGEARDRERERQRAGDDERRGRQTALSAQEQLQRERERNDALMRAQVKADAAYTAIGERSPPPMVGEAPAAYRKRLLRPLKAYSQTYRDVDTSGITDPAMLAIVEDRVFADAVEAGRNCSHLPDDRLYPRTETKGGREITRWYGRGTFIRDMKAPSMRVTKFTHHHRGAAGG